MKIPENRLEFFQSLLKSSIAGRDGAFDNIGRWYAQYRGDKRQSSGVDASVVRNITYELIESQVSTEIPTPRVRAYNWSEENERLARRCELLLKNVRDSLPLERLNDIDERYTYIFGGSVFYLEWDEDEKREGVKGRIRVNVLNPECFIGQPGVFETDDMEYCFIRFNTPISEIERRWGLCEGADSLLERADDLSAVVNICFYRNRKGYVSIYVFSGDAELSFVDDYYGRKKKYCPDCLSEKEFCECGSEKSILKSADTELVRKDIVKSTGEIIPAKSRIPWYRPRKFPIAIRRNTSLDKSVIGQSDCEFIKDQQEEINRVLTRVHEKLMMAGVYPYKPEDCSFRYDNSIGGKVLNLTRADSPDSFGIVDTTPDISKDLEYAENIYDSAKRILGISDTYQGNSDAKALSGKAKELEISQAAGRLESKRAMKCALYSELDELIFEYMLAFSDDEKPLARKDAFGRIHNEAFSRYDFVKPTSDGKGYYYDDAFIFSAYNEKQGESRKEAWERNLENYKAGVFGAAGEAETLLRYWQAQERAHYPGAKENTEYFKIIINESDPKGAEGNEEQYEK